VDAPAAPRARAGWKARAALFSAALWWGSLSAVGFMVVPMLFANLATPAMAGAMAGKLFAAQTWLSVGCCFVLFVSAMAQEEQGGSSLQWRGGALVFVIAGMLLALLSQFGVAPHILARDNLRLWHGVGSAMYLLEWLCGGIVLWKVSAATTARA
jgi:hypothetical protein